MFYFFSKSLKFIIDPAFYFYLFAFLSCIFLLKRKWRGWLRYLVAIYIIFFWVVTSPLPLYLMQKWESKFAPIPSPAHKTVGLVLSGGSLFQHRRSGQFFYNSKSFSRVIEGLHLLQEKHIDYLIITRGNNFRLDNSLLNEGDSVLKWANRLAIPTNKIIVMDDVLNTYDEINKAKEYLKKFSADDDFYLITGAFHMQRAYLIARKLSLNPTPYPVITSNPTEISCKWDLSHVDILFQYLNELVGLIAYRFQGYL